MTLTYLSSTLSEQEYITQRFKQANGTGRVTQAAINNAKYFTRDVFDKELILVLSDIRDEVKSTNTLDIALLFLQKLITWSAEDHPHIFTTPNACSKKGLPCMAKDSDVIKMYVSQMRLFMKKVAGIPITSEDIKDYKMSYPPLQDKEEAEPLTNEEFRRICDNEKSFRRQMMYRIKKDCEARIGAMVQLRKKHFNVTVRPIEVTFPKNIVKKSNGISYTNVKYVIEEDELGILQLLSTIPNDDDLVFGTNEDPVKATNNEEQVWSRKVQEIGFTARYAHNNRLKKNIHSIKAMTFTAAEEAVGVTYAHAYGDHSLYTKTYLRWGHEKKIKKFRLLEKEISVYSKTVEVHDSPEIFEKNRELERIILKMSKEKKLDNEELPDENLKKIMTAILKDNNII